MFTSAAVSHICCIYIDAVAWACPVTATAHFANTLLLHHLTPSPTSLNKWLQWVSEGFSAPAKQNYITRSTKSGLMWVGNRLSEDRWGHTLSACQDLPFPVRLKLPPSQSASVLQLCLPGSCYKEDTGVSLCTQVRKKDMKKKTGKHPGSVKETSCFYSLTCMDPTHTALWAIRL